MANYTIELRDLLEDEFFTLFDFEYAFYTDQEERQRLFEQKFCDHYYFDEIGFETAARFKHNLKSRLNMVMPKYTQLYESELKAKNIDFLLNKDLREEFIRTVESNSQNEQSSQANSSNKSSSSGSSTNSSDTESKASNLDNGLSSANLTSKLTSQDKSASTGKASSSETSSDQGSSTGSSQSQSKDNVLEKTIFESKGNIGVTSSSRLLIEWRECMINIDEMLIKECEDLFMVLY